MEPQRHEEHEVHKEKQKRTYQPVGREVEEIARKVVDAAYTVHKSLGPGLLESVYETCFCYELTKRGLKWRRQVRVPVVYDGKIFEDALRLDVLVENEIICELKAVESVLPLFRAQLLSHMKLLGKRLGFLINFNVPLIRDGITRLIL